jgi:flagellar hook assembly protein FlgD
LTGNFPNPFNPSTKVVFSLPRDGHAQLDVVDVRGHVVRTLHSGALPAGRHEVSWDGTDDLGRGAASGVYFARLRHGDRELTHKMLLNK